jgi:hypothetical protein
MRAVYVLQNLPDVSGPGLVEARMLQNGTIACAILYWTSSMGGTCTAPPDSLKMDAHASHQHLVFFLLPFLFLHLLVQGDGEEIPPQFKVQLDPQVSLA